jgi:hypothetical protein
MNRTRLIYFASVFLIFGPQHANAIVTSDGLFTHEVTPGVPAFGLNLAGVASLELGGASIGTGALVSDRHILTAAHVVDLDFDGFVDHPATIRRAKFYLPGGPVVIDLEPALFHLPIEWATIPQRDADIAIITLVADAPAGLPRYSLYGRADEIGRAAVIVGAGATGSGPLGGFDFLNDDTLRAGLNRLEAGGEDFDNLRFSLPPGYTLVYDFDSGLAENNTLLHLGVPSDLGFGVDEVNSYAGDSGGPAFIDGAIAGTILGNIGLYDSDATAEFVDSSWGELGYLMRVSSFQDFITTATEGQAVFVPEPATWLLLACGLLCAALARRLHK